MFEHQLRKAHQHPATLMRLEGLPLQESFMRIAARTIYILGGAPGIFAQVVAGRGIERTEIFTARGRLILAAVEVAPSPIGGDFHQCHIMRSEEHTSELQSLMRISYAVFCLKKKKTQKKT